MMHSDI